MAIIGFFRIVGAMLGTTSHASLDYDENEVANTSNRDKLQAYIADNYENIAKEVATECGEYVNGLLDLYVKYANTDEFSYNYMSADLEDGSLDFELTSDHLCAVLRDNYEAMLAKESNRGVFIYDLNRYIYNSIDYEQEPSYDLDYFEYTPPEEDAEDEF